MKVKITTLAENTAARPGLLAEWGLSILVETDEAVVLLDTGGSESTAAHNARRMGIDLSIVDKIVLSHAHGDHTGGLVEVLHSIGKPIDIIAHPGVWDRKFGKLPNLPSRYAGIPFNLDTLENLGAIFHLTSEPVKITENIMTTGEVEMKTPYEELDANLYIKKNGDLEKDTLPDDLALIINTGEGLAVITGCAHRGIINTLRHAQALTGVDYIHTVIGGTHLIRASKERLDSTIADLKTFGIQRLGVSHCTGGLPAARLALEFGEIFFFNNAGTEIIIE
ncbi:MAG: MBL fold metallo-hydrolase [Deltaproteobacteria bacterium]|nr:MBL fold metallo-hydrolase [Deltaproteobacteria bacterium]